MHTTAHDLIRRWRSRIGGILRCNGRKGAILVNISPCIRSIDSSDRDRQTPETRNWKKKKREREFRLAKAYDRRTSLGELTRNLVSRSSVNL